MRSYLKDIINDLKKSDTWKVQLTNDEERAMHLRCDNTEFMIYDNADEVIEDLFQSIFFR